MSWHKFGCPAFMIVLAVALVTGEPDAIVRKSNGCAGNAVANGVIIDAQGVLRNQVFADPTGQLTKQRVAGARAQLDPKVAAGSKLRKVSLNRLEAAIAAKLDAHQPLSEEIKNLAGLTRIQYVFCYPDTKDIVVAGPAEAFGPDLSGRMRGLDSGRPVVELQDLVTALRCFAPGIKKAPVMLVSIDPTPEGLSRMQQFLNQAGADRHDRQRLADQPGHAEHSCGRHFAEHPLRPGDDRSGLPHEVDRHRP